MLTIRIRTDSSGCLPKYTIAATTDEGVVQGWDVYYAETPVAVGKRIEAILASLQTDAALLRTKAVAAGTRLLTEDEVLEEAKRRRGGIEDLAGERAMQLLDNAGCDCGMDEPGTCVFCTCGNALRSLRQEIKKLRDENVRAAEWIEMQRIRIENLENEKRKQTKEGTDGY